MSGGVGLLAYAAYPIGFIFVMMSRQQLFTTNTVTPVVVVLDKDTGELSNMLRLWRILFVTNILGTLAFALAVNHAEILPSAALNVLLEEAAHKMENGFFALFIKGGGRRVAGSVRGLVGGGCSRHHLPAVAYLGAGIPHPGHGTGALHRG